MRKTLLQQYHELKESGSTSDFPNILANVMYKVMLDKFQGVNSPWKQYTMQSDLADFKTADRDLISEAPDLVEVDENGEYFDSQLTDYKYQITLKTFGRTFSISRKAIINDDLNALRAQPARFGRAAGRSLAKRIAAVIEGDPAAYDGTRLFTSGRNWSNVALTNDVAGATAVGNAMTGIRKATEPGSGEKMGLQPKYLIVCADLEIVANQLVRGAQVWPVSTSGGSPVNPVSGLTVLVEPFFSSTTLWMVTADPNDAPFVEVGFLDGKQTPDLLMKRADTINIAGGEDEWGYEFDEIFYKVRYDFAVAPAMWQGVYKGKS